LLDAWTSDRDAARLELLACLDGKDYRQFKKAYTRFLNSRPRIAGPARDLRLEPVLVRHVLPGRLWEHYGAVRAYEAALPGAPVETLHALRIESKRLRYALEFFEEILDPTIGDAIQSV